MRILFFLLIVLNAVYFVWNYLVPVPPPTPPAREFQGVAPLALLNERESGASAPDGVSSDGQTQGSPDVVSATRTCYTLGPLASVDRANTLSERISALGYAVTQRSIEQEEVSGYWVYLPPLASRSKALALAKEMAKKGVKDYYVVPNGENENAISLGLFSEAHRAERRTERIAELGYEASTTVRYRTRTLFWLDYDEAGAAPLSRDVWESDGEEGASIQRLARRCTG